jgi:hypothetical protein
MSKKRHKAPKLIDLTPQKMKEFLRRVDEKRLDEGDWEIIEKMANIISFVSQAQDVYGHPVGKDLQVKVCQELKKKHQSE